MMYGGRPFFSNFDDGYYSYGGHGYSPHSRSYHQRQERATAEAMKQLQKDEEERRRRQQQQQQRVAYLNRLQEEEERRRRQQQQQQRAAYLNRLQEEEDHRRAYDEAMRRRQEEAEQAERRGRRRNHSFWDDYCDETDSANESDEEEPVYRVVRGPDGRLYRVNLDNATRSKQPKKTAPLRKEERKKSKRLGASRTNILKPNNSFTPTKVKNKPTKVDTLQVPADPQQDFKKNAGKKKRATDLVEDASDSEYEEDRQNSVWCNRHPSPGEWIEPVEGFENLDLH